MKMNRNSNMLKLPILFKLLPVCSINNFMLLLYLATFKILIALKDVKIPNTAINLDLSTNYFTVYSITYISTTRASKML